MTDSDATSSTLRVEMTAESNGAEYRCFITNSAGEMASTRIATVKLDILDWTMEYNTSGQRTKRISDEKTYTYIYAGDKLMRMTVGDDVLDFSYDASGAPLTMTYNGTVYYYITNLQGDVTSLQQANGGTGAQYAYDAWGNIIAMSGTLAELNPLRYRGYVYDQETGFYYLNSRYYDPEIGRFINVDDEISNVGGNELGYNLFAYCFNNPVNLSDQSGSWPSLSQALGAVAVAAAAVAVVAIVVAAPALAIAGAGATVVSGALGVAATALAVSATAATASAVAKVVEETKTSGPYRNQSVYIMRDQENKVEYVGRTNDPVRRQYEHSRDPSKSHLQPLEVKFTNLTVDEARVVEQLLISTYTLDNLLNARREISQKKIGSFTNSIHNTVKLFENLAEDEALNLMGR